MLPSLGWLQVSESITLVRSGCCLHLLHEGVWYCSAALHRQGVGFIIYFQVFLCNFFLIFDLLIELVKPRKHSMHHFRGSEICQMTLRTKSLIFAYCGDLLN